jgi:hypothetical protein
MSSSAVSPPRGESASRATRGPQFTLRQLMIAVAGVALLLTPFPHILWLIVAFGDAVLLGFAFYKVARLHPRIRLMVEIATALALLAQWVWYSRPPSLLWQASRAENLAGLCSALAESTDNPRAKKFFLKHSAWYDRRASSLQLQAWWYALTGAKWKRPVESSDDQELIRELGILEAMDRYGKRDARVEERLRQVVSGAGMHDG